MKIGSEAHKVLFCESFMASHRVYEPEQLSLPDLDPASAEVLQGVPFWDEALYTERRAGMMLSAYAEQVEDPLLQKAIALQAREEARHGRLIEHMLKLYNIEVPQRLAAKVPQDLESAFIKFGYGECFDSFFAFGLFSIVRQAELVPEQLFTVFDPILDEEARHIVFFVNWIAYKQIQEGRGFLRGLNSLWQYSGALQRRLSNLQGNGKASNNEGSGEGFTATGAKSFTSDLTLERFLQACLEENEKRMSLYDDRLLRPQFLPIATSMALKVLRLKPRRKLQPVNTPT